MVCCCCFSALSVWCHSPCCNGATLPRSNSIQPHGRHCNISSTTPSTVVPCASFVFVFVWLARERARTHKLTQHGKIVKNSDWLAKGKGEGGKKGFMFSVSGSGRGGGARVPFVVSLPPSAIALCIARYAVRGAGAPRLARANTRLTSEPTH